MVAVMPGADPFLFQTPGSDTACLLLHGFTATPQEMRRLGNFLHSCGFSVSCPLLAGHGTDVRDLAATTWQDWQQSAYDGWLALSQAHKHVFTIGLSLGGALALYQASQVPLSGLVAMATPLLLDPRLLWLARAVKRWIPYRKKGPSNMHDPEALAARVAYDREPTSSSEQVLLFFRELWERLPEVTAPVLLMHSCHDQSVKPDTMPRIYGRLGSVDRQMVWLENSGHIVTEDYDRMSVYRAIRAFCEQRT